MSRGCRLRWSQTTRLGLAALVLAVANTAPGSRTALAQRSAYEELQTLSGVLNHIRRNYVDSVSYRHMVSAAIDGVLKSLDPHSYFVRQSDWAKTMALSHGELGITGLVLEDVSGFVTVMSVGLGSSAARAGIMPGDRVLKVEDELTAGSGARAVELLLAGEEGSKVRVTFARGPRLEPDTFSVKLKRTDYEWLSVTKVDMIDSLTGYVRLEQLRSDSGDELHDALRLLRRQHASQVILDLRGNPGGLLDAAVDVASEFLPKNTLVFATDGRKRDTDRRYLTEDDGDFRRLPLILLIDESSASASEALAGSFQDHDRALILGRRSFGKALVQSPFYLSSGDVVWLTTARVVTPSGRSIQRPYRGLAVEQYQALAGSEPAAPDTAPLFNTANGRQVRGGGGIHPDVALPAPATLPAWWSVAVERGFDAGVADSVAYTLPEDDSRRLAWLGDREEWRANLLPPFLDRVRVRLGVQARPSMAVQDRIALLLAARTAEVRWGSEARRELEMRNDADISAALGYFSSIDRLLAPPERTDGPDTLRQP